MHSDGLVRAYNRQEAEGNRLLIELEKGKYSSTDTYAYHKWIIAGKDILLLTDKRLAYVCRNEIFGGWQVSMTMTQGLMCNIGGEKTSNTGHFYTQIIILYNSYTVSE